MIKSKLLNMYVQLSDEKVNKLSSAQGRRNRRGVGWGVGARLLFPPLFIIIVIVIVISISISISIIIVSC